MTDTEKLTRIAAILADTPTPPAPLPESIESNLRALAADWLESPQHHAYGQTILDVLAGN